MNGPPTGDFHSTYNAPMLGAHKRIERDSGKAAADGVLTGAVHPRRWLNKEIHNGRPEQEAGPGSDRARTRHGRQHGIRCGQSQVLFSSFSV